MMRYEEYGCYEEEEEVVGESYPRGPLNTAECCSYPRGPYNTSFQEFRFIQAIRVPPHKRTVQVGPCGLRLGSTATFKLKGQSNQSRIN